MKVLRDPLLWLSAMFYRAAAGVALQRAAVQRAVSRTAASGLSAGEFCFSYPGALWLVALSSLAATVVGVVAGIAVTRPAGHEFRPLVETIAAMGQTFPPVAVLAIAVPVMGFGWQPALIALVLYGILPVLQGTLAGIGTVPSGVLAIAQEWG
ncbi:Osmoprotectant ABC transporter inner membrane protein YehW [Klebsiella michiganensis]|nr:Osmoprotectant ABC transporter inner membrane protein YehW [Klebsiella michiganensis]